AVDHGSRRDLELGVLAPEREEIGARLHVLRVVAARERAREHVGGVAPVLGEDGRREERDESDRDGEASHRPTFSVRRGWLVSSVSSSSTCPSPSATTLIPIERPEASRRTSPFS